MLSDVPNHLQHFLKADDKYIFHNNWSLCITFTIVFSYLYDAVFQFKTMKKFYKS